MFHFSVGYCSLWVNLLWIALCCTVDALWVLSLWTVRAFTVDCTVLHCSAGTVHCGLHCWWGHLRRPPPQVLHWKRAPWAAHMWRLSCLPGAEQTQRHLALGLHPLGCRPSAMWCLGSTTPSLQHSATWRLVCLLLGAAQTPRGFWATYTFSVITSIGIKNIILTFLTILFFLIINF